MEFMFPAHHQGHHLWWCSGKEPASQCRRSKRHGSNPCIWKISWRRAWSMRTLQYSCLESPMDRGVWRATVHGVAKTQTRLKRLSMHRADSFSTCEVFPFVPCCLICFLAPRPEWSSPRCMSRARVTLPRQHLPRVLPWPSIGVSIPTSVFSLHCHIVCLFPAKCRQAQIQNIVDELSSTVPRTRLEENRFLF